jgi:hypothetical protein
MKILRGVSAPAPSTASPNDDFPEALGESDEIHEFPVKAANLFRARLSAVRAYDEFYMESVLRAAAEKRPVVMQALILVAEAMGVPLSWGQDSFDYAEAVIAELQRQDEPVPEALVRFREEMRERAIEYAAAKTKPPVQARRIHKWS